jgi:hypothetical protein
VIGAGPGTRVFLVPWTTDLRRSFDGLQGLVRSHLAENPRAGHLFVFCNQRRTRLKVLHFDGTRLCLWPEGKGTERCEQSAALALIRSLPALDGKIVTADPLHCQRKSAHAIVEKGGDYLSQIKGNQPGLLKQARALDALVGTPFLPRRRAVTAGSKSAPSMPSASSRWRPTFPSPAA